MSIRNLPPFLPDLEHLSRLGAIVKQVADRELLPRFNRTCALTADRKLDGSIVTEADTELQKQLALQLQSHWPQIPLLGEELVLPEQMRILQGGANSYWCLDPLDGTSNFASGLPFFAVSLALIENGRARVGVVYDPCRNECFTALNGAGAWLNGDPISCDEDTVFDELGRCIAVVDLKRLPKDLVIRLAHAAPYHSQRNFGACALEWCWLAARRFQLYLHGKQQIWDYAAGHLIFSQTPGVSSTLYNEPVFANRIQPRSVVAAVNRGLHEKWLAWTATNDSH
jgi:myo-inositol-1(or 4)-monophosphatase